jgi:hypothetical protein
MEDPDVLYSLGQFLDEWKLHCKFGTLLKICCTDKDEIVDVAVLAHSGQRRD